VFSTACIYNGAYFSSLEGATGLPDDISRNVGVMVFGKLVPIWAVAVPEFIPAYSLEIFMGSPLSFSLACRVSDPGPHILCCLKLP